jgi:hypothetical protein
MLYSELQPTIFSRLAEAKKKFRIFYHDFPTSLVLLQNLKQEVRSNYVPFETEFNTFAGGPADQFPDFSFIEARYYGRG